LSVSARLSRKLPVVDVVGLRVETVVERIGIQLQRQAQRLTLVTLQTQTCTQVMTQMVVVPGQGDTLRGNAQILQLVVVPRIVQAYAT
jgi:hypothetical protein